MAYNFSQMTSFFFFFFFFSLLFVVCFHFSDAQKVPGMYVFGDSLVDVGNNNYLKISVAKANFPHNGIDFPGKKPTGRFSNGKNSADFLAEKVGFVASPPPYLSLVSKSNNSNGFPITGVSFASGGAGIFNGTDERFRQSIPLTKQVEHYKKVYEDLVQKLGSVAAQDHLSKSLFTVVIGSNDMLGFFSSGSDQAKKTTPQQFTDSMLLALKLVLKHMHDFGARKYVIAGIGAVGCCPSQRNENKDECNEEANTWSVKYNEALKTMLLGLKSELNGMDYSYVDVYSVFAGFIETPSNFGLLRLNPRAVGWGTSKPESRVCRLPPTAPTG